MKIKLSEKNSSVVLSSHRRMLTREVRQIVEPIVPDRVSVVDLAEVVNNGGLAVVVAERGAGKTTLCKAISRAMQIQFFVEPGMHSNPAVNCSLLLLNGLQSNPNTTNIDDLVVESSLTFGAVSETFQNLLGVQKAELFSASLKIIMKKIIRNAETVELNKSIKLFVSACCKNYDIDNDTTARLIENVISLTDLLKSDKPFKTYNETISGIMNSSGDFSSLDKSKDGSGVKALVTDLIHIAGYAMLVEILCGSVLTYQTEEAGVSTGLVIRETEDGRRLISLSRPNFEFWGDNASTTTSFDEACELRADISAEGFDSKIAVIGATSLFAVHVSSYSPEVASAISTSRGSRTMSSGAGAGGLPPELMWSLQSLSNSTVLNGAILLVELRDDYLPSNADSTQRQTYAHRLTAASRTAVYLPSKGEGQVRFRAFGDIVYSDFDMVPLKFSLEDLVSLENPALSENNLLLSEQLSREERQNKSDFLSKGIGYAN